MRAHLLERSRAQIRALGLYSRIRAPTGQYLCWHEGPDRQRFVPAILPRRLRVTLRGGCRRTSASWSRHPRAYQLLWFGAKPLRPDRRELDAVNGVPIHRVLGQYAYGPKPLLPPWTLTQARRELADARYFLKLFDELAPDVVNWWSMNGLSKILLPLPARYGCPDVHFVEDPWMIREYGRDGELASGFWASLWDGEWGPGVARPLLRRLGRWSERRTDRQGIPTRRLPNRPSHVCFVSRLSSEPLCRGGASVHVLGGHLRRSLDRAVPLTRTTACRVRPSAATLRRSAFTGSRATHAR